MRDDASDIIAGAQAGDDIWQRTKNSHVRPWMTRTKASDQESTTSTKSNLKALLRAFPSPSSENGFPWDSDPLPAEQILTAHGVGRSLNFATIKREVEVVGSYTTAADLVYDLRALVFRNVVGTKG